MSKKHILVTGGAGFIGSAIVPELVKNNLYVSVIDNLSFGKRELLPIDDSLFYKGDILDKKWLKDTIEKIEPDVIIHLAALHFIPYCNQNPMETARVNIEGTLNLLDACRFLKKKPEKIIFASTAAVYPICDYATDEDHECAPMDIYGLTKLTGEKLVHEFHLVSGIPAVVCRFFNAFGPNETNPHLFPEIERQIKSGARTVRLGNLTPKRDFIHTFDMAQAVLALINHQGKPFDTFNLGRGKEYSVVEIVNAFEKVLGEKISIEVDDSRVRKIERMHLLADISKLSNATGWKPKWEIEQGVADLLADYK